MLNAFWPVPKLIELVQSLLWYFNLHVVIAFGVAGQNTFIHDDVRWRTRAAGLCSVLDFSAVFYIVDHSLLLERLVCYGFTPPAIMWIKSYLSNRTQRVFFNGSLQHNPGRIRNSPGQLSRPLTFSMFTNDMPLTLSKASVSMYADYSTLYMSATTATEMTATLNKELQLVSE